MEKFFRKLKGEALRVAIVILRSVWETEKLGEAGANKLGSRWLAPTASWHRWPVAGGPSRLFRARRGGQATLIALPAVGSPSSQVSSEPPLPSFKEFILLWPSAGQEAGGEGLQGGR